MYTRSISDASSHAIKTSTCNINAHALQVVRHTGNVLRVELEVGVAGRAVLAVVLETVQVLVSLAADLAAVGLLFLHADCAGVRDRSRRVDDREGAVRILLELLVLMTMLEQG